MGERPAAVREYEFTYRGARLDDVVAAAEDWSAEHGCRLEVVELLTGARLRIRGPDAAVRDAIRRVREWIRSAT